MAREAHIPHTHAGLKIGVILAGNLKMHISVKTLENSAAKTLEVSSLQCATTGSDSNLWC